MCSRQIWSTDIVVQSGTRRDTWLFAITYHVQFVPGVRRGIVEEIYNQGVQAKCQPQRCSAHTQTHTHARARAHTHTHTHSQTHTHISRCHNYFLIEASQQNLNPDYTDPLYSQCVVHGRAWTLRSQETVSFVFELRGLWDIKCVTRAETLQNSQIRE